MKKLQLARTPLLRAALIVSALTISFAASAQEVPQNVKAALNKANAAVAKIVKIPAKQRTFTNTIGALDDLSVHLDNDTSLTIFMQFVHPDPKIRDSARAADEAVSNWAIELGKREDLYKAVKQYADTKPKLTGEKARLLEFTMRDYRLAGMTLPKDKRKRLLDIEKEMNKLSIDFETNIAEDPTKIAFTKEELKGVPEDLLGRQTESNGIYLLGMDGPTYGGVMDYSENPLTRQKMWTLYRRRAGTKNVEILEKLIKLRSESATLLGFKNLVDNVTFTRMAKSSEGVRKFYDELAPLVRRKAEADMAEFTAKKREHTGDSSAMFNPWDYAFYKNLLLKDKYAVDSEKVKEYFPMEKVVDGLFTITSTLFNIEYKDVTSKAKELGLPVWHPDVKLYEVYDKDSKELLGRMYTDLYPREAKYNHAACWGLQPRKVWADGKTQKPLAALVCNFSKPTADKPSLLPHDEVETFFHEFGHGLHQMLTHTQFGRFSGTAVARDFVEAPSQMLENWVWEAEPLKLFAKHYQTGEVLPESTLDGMKKARTLGSGIETQGQFYLGEMDQAFHTAPGGVVDTTKIGQEVYEKTTLYKAVPGTMFQAAFGHLTGYEGAYYGYMWSLVYAQDMFQRFLDKGILNPEAGMYYRTKILGRGGTMDEMAMLEDYLGRKPQMDAFLRHLGLER